MVRKIFLNVRWKFGVLPSPRLPIIWKFRRKQNILFWHLNYCFRLNK